MKKAGKRGATFPGLFPDTAEKQTLRARDHGLIQALCQRKARRLSYCGLAGVNARDVEVWQGALDQITVVERPIADAALRAEFETRLLLKLAPLFNGNVDIFYADIWEFLASGDFRGRARFPEVINLDFCGGMINKVDMHYPVQREAFQALFESGRRNKTDFLLIFTLLPRDRGKATYKKYLADYVQSLRSNVPAQQPKKLSEQLDANLRFHSRTNLGLFKACLPLLIEDIGRSHNYRVSNVYTRLYTKMIHFVFECTFIAGVLGLPPDVKTSIKVLNAPLRKLLADGQERQTWPPLIDGV